MASWATFEAAAPTLAATGRQFFYLYGVRMGFLATVRRDGGPRVHPICPILTEDALFALIVPVSPMMRSALDSPLAQDFWVTQAVNAVVSGSISAARSCAHVAGPSPIGVPEQAPRRRTNGSADSPRTTLRVREG